MINLPLDKASQHGSLCERQRLHAEHQVLHGLWSPVPAPVPATLKYSNGASAPMPLLILPCQQRSLRRAAKGIEKCTGLDEPDSLGPVFGRANRATSPGKEEGRAR